MVCDPEYRLAPLSPRKLKELCCQGWAGTHDPARAPVTCSPVVCGGVRRPLPEHGQRDEARPSWRRGSLPLALLPASRCPSALGVGGTRFGLWIIVLGSPYPVTSISPPPVTQPEGHDPRLPLGTSEGGQRTPLRLPRGGPSPRKPQRCPFGLGGGWGVWYREQVGPALPVCVSFCLSLILATNPDTRERVPNEQLFERLGVKPLHVVCLGVSF